MVSFHLYDWLLYNYLTTIVQDWHVVSIATWLISSPASWNAIPMKTVFTFLQFFFPPWNISLHAMACTKNTGYGSVTKLLCEICVTSLLHFHLAVLQLYLKRAHAQREYRDTVISWDCACLAAIRLTKGFEPYGLMKDDTSNILGLLLTHRVGLNF